MRTSQKGFTLVELIVVITILAILGTIAFISLQGYGQDARDSKVVSDLTSISREIEAKLTQDGNLSVHALSANDLRTTNGVTATGGSFGNNIPFFTASGHAYEVGRLDYIELGLNREEFLDANNRDYLIGSVTMTDASNSYRFFQVVGQRGGGDTRQAVVRGSYFFNGGANTGLVSQTGSSVVGVQNNESLATGLY